MPGGKKVPIKGSQKVPLPNATVLAPAPPDERLEVTVRVRPRNPLPTASSMLKPNAQVSAITHEEYEKNYAADAKDLAAVKKFAQRHNLYVVRESPARRIVILSGSVADMNDAFGVNLKTYEYPGGTYRGRTGAVKVPAELKNVVEGVFGLDNRPVAKRHSIIHHAAAPAAADGAVSFNPNQVAAIYNFPPGTDGTGQTIGIIELGGGYRPNDLKNYFKSLGLPLPTVIPVSVDGATNAPSTPDSADAEVVLDIQVAGAAAPGAKIVVYFAPNDRTAKGFLDALTKAVHDTVNNPSVISISWGGAESIPNNSFQTQFDQALQAAAMLGITVCVAAGDDGAADLGPGEWDGNAHCDFPSSSPFALACGGTRLIAHNGVISAESVWNQHAADTAHDSFGSGGGGVSGAFPLPAYQNNANVSASLNPKGKKGRGLPDVTGDGDPASGYNILVDGQPIVVGGTSAVAPLWAGLIARINQLKKGRVGFINPQIYTLSGGFHDVTAGDNQVSFGSHKNVGYKAGPGWDACSGLGSPDGASLAGLLTAHAPAASSVAKKKAATKKKKK